MIGRRTIRTRHTKACVKFGDAVRPTTAWYVTEEDAAAINEANGTAYEPLLVPEPDILVRIIKEVHTPDKEKRRYFLALIASDDGEKHLLTTIPATNTLGRSVCTHPTSVGAYVRGKVGLIPADNVALFFPFFTPNIVYKYRLGEPAPMRFTGRQTLTNIEDRIMG